MEELSSQLKLVEKIKFTCSPKCLQELDNRLQDILLLLDEVGHFASGELIDLKGCSWTLHERYYLDTEDALKWTFYHTKHRIVRNCLYLLKRYPAKSVA